MARDQRGRLFRRAGIPKQPEEALASPLGRDFDITRHGRARIGSGFDTVGERHACRHGFRKLHGAAGADEFVAVAGDGMRCTVAGKKRHTIAKVQAIGISGEQRAGLGIL